MGRDTLWEVRDETGHHPEGLGRVRTPFGRFGTDRDTLR